MKRTATRLALLVLLSVGIPLAWAGGKAEYPKPVEKKLWAADLRGKPAPDFVVEKWISSQPVRKGKVVLIDFWATWCPPCRAAIPELNKIAKACGDDLAVIGISDEPADVIEDFNKGDVKIKYNSAIDTRKRMKSAFAIEGIPHVVIISTDGIVRWQGFPFDDTEPLSLAIVKQIIAADPGVQARHANESQK